MSGRNYEVSLRIRLANTASQALKRFHREVQQDTRNTSRAFGTLSDSTRQLDRDMGRLQGRSQGLLRTLREMANTRGPQALISGVRLLSREIDRAHRMLKGGAGIAAGVAAGGYVMAQPVARTMDYSMSLANLANTAYAGTSLAVRRAGKHSLDASIRTAVRQGGGTREGALDALNSLISQGMDRNAAMALLPRIMRTSTAANADANDIAGLVMKARTSGGIRDNQVGSMLDMALVSGQMGGFELKDMARWLPRQMASASKAGMGGMKDLSVLLAANQAAIATSGSADEAGNNVSNLLNKITSMDTQKDAKRLGIDLAGTLSQARARGVDPLTAFADLADRVSSRDPRYKALKAKAAAATTPEAKRAIYEQQAAIFEGSSLGQLIQDQEATKALVGFMGQRNEIRRQTGAKYQGAVDSNFALIAEESGFKVQQAANEKAFAENDAFTGLASAAGDAAKAMGDMAQKHPKLAAATVAATKALAALAATAAAGSVAGFLTRGGAAAAEGAAARAAARGGTAAAARVLAQRLGIGAIMAGTMDVGALATAGATGAATVAGGVLAAGAAGYGVGTLAYKGLLEDTSAGDKLTSLIAHAMAAAGNADAKRMIQVQVMLDGEQIAASVNTNNTRKSRRE